MAITSSSRLGITRWSVDTDTVSRAQFDGDHGKLDDITAMDMQGTLANRPAAAAANRGLYYFVTGDATAVNNDRIWRSTGAVWIEVATRPTADAAYVQRSQVVSAAVAAGESTTSAVFVDLATVGPTVNAAVGSSGRALVIIQSLISNSTAGAGGIVTVTGDNVTADLSRRLQFDSAAANFQSGGSATFLLTGLPAGAQNFRLQYRQAGGGTATFEHRGITVIPL